MTKPYTPVAYVFDANYLNYACVAIYSLVKASTSPVKLYCVTPELDPEQTAALESFLGRTGIAHQHIKLGAQWLSGFRGQAHFSVMTYAKLCLPELVPEDRLIYIDVDTITRGDLRELYLSDMGGLPMAGVADPVGGKSSRMPYVARDNYINAGVLLMNLTKLREIGYYDRCAQIYTDHTQQVTWGDQCVTNKALEGEILIIEPKWNTQLFSDFLDMQRWNTIQNDINPRILHFLGDAKPWSGWCSPLIGDFWKNMARLANIESKTVPISTLGQLIRFGEALHRAQRFEEASKIKSDVIRNLQDKRMISTQPKN